MNERGPKADVVRARLLAAGRGPAWIDLTERLCECPVVSGTRGLTKEAVAELSPDGHEDYCPAKLADEGFEAVRDEILAASRDR